MATVETALSNELGPGTSHVSQVDFAERGGLSASADSHSLDGRQVQGASVSQAVSFEGAARAAASMAVPSLSVLGESALSAADVEMESHLTRNTPLDDEGAGPATPSPQAAGAPQMSRSGLVLSTRPSTSRNATPQLVSQPRSITHEVARGSTRRTSSPSHRDVAPQLSTAGEQAPRRAPGRSAATTHGDPPSKCKSTEVPHGHDDSPRPATSNNGPDLCNRAPDEAEAPDAALPPGACSSRVANELQRAASAEPHPAASVEAQDVQGTPALIREQSLDEADQRADVGPATTDHGTNAAESHAVVPTDHADDNDAQACSCVAGGRDGCVRASPADHHSTLHGDSHDLLRPDNAGRSGAAARHGAPSNPQWPDGTSVGNVSQALSRGGAASAPQARAADSTQGVNADCADEDEDAEQDEAGDRAACGPQQAQSGIGGGAAAQEGERHMASAFGEQEGRHWNRVPSSVTLNGSQNDAESDQHEDAASLHGPLGLVEAALAPGRAEGAAEAAVPDAAPRGASNAVSDRAGGGRSSASRPEGLCTTRSHDARFGDGAAPLPRQASCANASAKDTDEQPQHGCPSSVVTGPGGTQSKGVPQRDATPGFSRHAAESSGRLAMSPNSPMHHAAHVDAPHGPASVHGTVMTEETMSEAGTDLSSMHRSGHQEQTGNKRQVDNSSRRMPSPPPPIPTVATATIPPPRLLCSSTSPTAMPCTQQAPQLLKRMVAP